jgi:hypothetical protein
VVVVEIEVEVEVKEEEGREEGRGCCSITERGHRLFSTLAVGPVQS